MKRGSVRTYASSSTFFFLLPLPERGAAAVFSLSWLCLGIMSFRSHVPVLFRKGVRVVRDDDQNSTDLMKCIQSLQEKEEADGVDVGGLLLPFAHDRPAIQEFIISLLYFMLFFSDSLRRRLTLWLLWATRSDRPLVVVSTQAPQKRTPTVRRRGRERRLGPR
jgi:hypothetical protein